MVTEEVLLRGGLTIMICGVTEGGHVGQMRVGHDRRSNVVVAVEEWDERAIGPGRITSSRPVISQRHNHHNQQ